MSFLWPLSIQTTLFRDSHAPSLQNSRSEPLIDYFLNLIAIFISYILKLVETLVSINKCTTMLILSGILQVDQCNVVSLDAVYVNYISRVLFFDEEIFFRNWLIAVKELIIMEGFCRCYLAAFVVFANSSSVSNDTLHSDPHKPV